MILVGFLSLEECLSSLLNGIEWKVKGENTKNGTSRLVILFSENSLEDLMV
jgi:hypothetical protein